MTDEHKHLEAIAAALDAKADDLFGDIAVAEAPAEETAKAQAYRRAAEIIRYQMECEA